MALAQPMVVLVVVLLVGLLVLAYRDRRGVQLSDQLTALLTMLVGVTFGMLWELLEFILDWAISTDLQPTNTDTMTDLLAANVAAVVGGGLATWLYCHWLKPARRQQLGNLAGRLFDGPSRVLDRHGLAMIVAFTALLVLAVTVLWFAGRSVPGFPLG
jgi:hypothetical protein